LTLSGPGGIIVGDTAEERGWGRPIDRDLMRAHLLHIGKTGGNALKHALRPYNTSGALDIVFHPHAVRLSDVPVGESVLFMLRDPVDRFVSGFNSRRRRGRPLNNFEWTQDEAAAFTAFPTANELAEALSVAEDRRRAAAVGAMRGIYHVKSSYADWLVDFDYLGSRRDDISWVGLTSRLADDFERLKQILGLPIECVLPGDPVASHRRLDADETCLSPVGIKNIERWYAADYPFLTYFAAEAAGGIARYGS
jgi:hypothetical protein